MQVLLDQPGPTSCPVFQVARRLLKKIHGPMVPSWAQRPYKKATAGDEAQRRLATPAECAEGCLHISMKRTTRMEVNFHPVFP